MKIIEAQNILIFDRRWVITDLGISHQKTITESSDTGTARKPGSDEYAPPESSVVSRKYDVWSMAAIGCDLLVWLKEGSDGFRDFRWS